jgi:hypothetical protein
MIEARKLKEKVAHVMRKRFVVVGEEERVSVEQMERKNEDLRRSLKKRHAVRRR